MPDDQRDVIDFPEQGVLFWDAVKPVEIIQTHVSLVLLAGDCTYKLKTRDQISLPGPFYR
jgi:aminoglycoside phosphotransferase family enzyme